MCAASFHSVSCTLPSNFLIPSGAIVLPPLIAHFDTEVLQFEVLLQPVPVGHHLCWVLEWGIQSVLIGFPIFPVMLQLL